MGDSLMQSIAAVETTIIIFVVIFAMGTWDGLIRRHIRVSIDPIGLFLHIRGGSALLLGALSLLVEIGLFRISLPYLLLAWLHCSITKEVCLYTSLVEPILSWWASMLGLAMSVTIFALWIPGALDMQGPYHDRFLAPGVWYREKEMAMTVQEALSAHQCPPMQEDKIINVSERMLYDLHFFKRVLTQTRPLDPVIMAEVYLPRARKQFRTFPSRTSRVVTETIFRYYFTKYEQATHIWPWLRIINGY
jgi:hypothetical protein